MLRLVALPFIRALRNATLQLYNARAHVSNIFWIFLDAENVRLLKIAADRLTRHHLPVTTIDELRYLIETA